MPIRDIALALGVVLIWGLNFVAIKWGVDEVPPFLLTALRYIGCALPAVFFTMGLAVLLLGDRPTPLQYGGAAIALAGLGTIGAEHLGGAILVPLLLTLVAAFFWAISNIVNKRAGKIDMLAFVIWGSLVPPLPMLALSLGFEGPQALAGLLSISPQAVFSVLFIAYGSTLVGYGAWAVLLGRHKASLIAPFSLLVPVVGFIAAFIFLGEQMTALEVAGSLLIFAGLLLNVFGPRLLARLRVA